MALPQQPWRRHAASGPRFGVVMLVVGCGLGRDGASKLAKIPLNGSNQRVTKRRSDRARVANSPRYQLNQRATNSQNSRKYR
eukprot:13160146-Alexandrium_andersonii.AAC.1